MSAREITVEPRGTWLPIREPAATGPSSERSGGSWITDPDRAAEARLTLDSGDRRSAIDRAGMLDAIGTLPAQLRAAADRFASIPPVAPQDGAPIRSVVVLGMGGSAIGADIVRGSFADRLRVPLVVHRDADLPPWVDEHTLVVASSHSGRTEETLGAFQATLDRGSPSIAITTGGTLSDLATAAGRPVVQFEAPGQPRAAVGHAAGLLLAVLGSARLVEANVPDELRRAADAAADALRPNAPDVPLDANPAKQLALAVVDLVCVVLGADHLGAVARRWRTQLNENAKVWATWDEFPELNHNAVVGFGGPAWTCEQLFVVGLAAAGEPSRVRERREAVLELLDEARTGGSIVRLPAAPRFGQAFAGIAFGDLVSVYVALLRGIDPTPVEAIARLKVRLAHGQGGV